MNAFGAGGTRESVNKIERNWHKAGWSERIKGMIVIRDLAESVVWQTCPIFDPR
jgi:hypothetical protein